MCVFFLNISPILLYSSCFVCNAWGEQPSDRPVPNATLQVTGAVGWRREGLVYKKNEVSCVLSCFHYLSLFPYYWGFTTLIHCRSSWILWRVWIFLCLQKVGHDFSLSPHWCLLDCLLIVMILGVVLRSDVTGKILMKCFLSGMPDLKLGLNDKIGLEKESQLKSRPTKR